jgi:hypothetical protein
MFYIEYKQVIESKRIFLFLVGIGLWAHSMTVCDLHERLIGNLTAEARPVIKRLCASVFGGPDGKQLKASIMDENPVTPAAINLTVNSRYPDTVPLTTVPSQVLQTMPKLTEDLEYRFIGDWLILLDVHAHVIADFIEDVLPK